ncbi:MAG: hypothetical protein MZV64_13250 [Ignavibacteriales bacterium]|nr:hypothetical protein [Ignavibacteriales bacterium]
MAPRGFYRLCPIWYHSGRGSERLHADLARQGREVRFGQARRNQGILGFAARPLRRDR